MSSRQARLSAFATTPIALLPSKPPGYGSSGVTSPAMRYRIEVGSLDNTTRAREHCGEGRRSVAEWVLLGDGGESTAEPVALFFAPDAAKSLPAPCEIPGVFFTASHLAVRATHARGGSLACLKVV